MAHSFWASSESSTKCIIHSLPDLIQAQRIKLMPPVNLSRNQCLHTAGMNLIPSSTDRNPCFRAISTGLRRTASFLMLFLEYRSNKHSMNYSILLHLYNKAKHLIFSDQRMQPLTSKDKQDTEEHRSVPEAAGADPWGSKGQGTPAYCCSFVFSQTFTSEVKLSSAALKNFMQTVQGVEVLTEGKKEWKRMYKSQWKQVILT